jgi:16S rRNA C1402 N4-methylase RsmH
MLKFDRKQAAQENAFEAARMYSNRVTAPGLYEETAEEYLDSLDWMYIIENLKEYPSETRHQKIADRILQAMMKAPLKKRRKHSLIPCTSDKLVRAKADP